jgi:hypothetical protein
MFSDPSLRQDKLKHHARYDGVNRGGFPPT